MTTDRDEQPRRYRIRHRETGLWLLAERTDSWVPKREWASVLTADHAREIARELNLSIEQYKITAE
jgi:hypothetical protein